MRRISHSEILQEQLTHSNHEGPSLYWGTGTIVGKSLETLERALATSLFQHSDANREGRYCHGITVRLKLINYNDDSITPKNQCVSMRHMSGALQPPRPPYTPCKNAHKTAAVCLCRVQQGVRQARLAETTFFSSSQYGLWCKYVSDSRWFAGLWKIRSKSPTGMPGVCSEETQVYRQQTLPEVLSQKHRMRIRPESRTGASARPVANGG